MQRERGRRREIKTQKHKGKMEMKKVANGVLVIAAVGCLSLSSAFAGGRTNVNMGRSAATGGTSSQRGFTTINVNTRGAGQLQPTQSVDRWNYRGSVEIPRLSAGLNYEGGSTHRAAVLWRDN
jgi:hypothetical protein